VSLSQSYHEPLYNRIYTGCLKAILGWKHFPVVGINFHGRVEVFFKASKVWALIHLFLGHPICIYTDIYIHYVIHIVSFGTVLYSTFEVIKGLEKTYCNYCTVQYSTVQYSTCRNYCCLCKILMDFFIKLGNLGIII